ncbi:thioredoxin family protein [Aliiroseovarius sp. KMU-50]|uniref:Thioredoxin family protein n=1 Tax=Aliiroseovarius salicola TaxID=3009082 RepID=A0ABT4W210_9RHOB|nr:thioredoxin family protein [Aliiroseovarius sp. KMU-50]MDA5094545.1 thioredoxin family protein [Aliiroseovarius sp. KMU-50]
MVDEPGCVWCAQWESDLGMIYPKTPEGNFAPLKKIGLRKIRSDQLAFSLKRPVSFTPTFLLIEGGHEMARIEGYPGEDFFWGLLERMLTEHTTYVRPEG